MFPLVAARPAGVGRGSKFAASTGGRGGLDNTGVGIRTAEPAPTTSEPEPAVATVSFRDTGIDCR